jgi:hypothetical protein
MSVREIKADLEKRWKDDPVVRLCIAILDYMAALPADQLRMLTFRALISAVGKERLDDELMRAMTILVSSRIAALDARALLVDDDQSEHELNPQELAEARATGRLVHPETGELVSEFESKVIPFFVPSARFFAVER